MIHEYNVVLLPERELALKSIEASRKINEASPSEFVLDDINYFAHLTIYMVRIEEASKLTLARNRLSEIALRNTTLILPATRYGQNMGFVNASYERTVAVDELQADILDGLGSLRDGLPREQTEQIKTAEGMRLENLQVYGFAGIGEPYNPHITLARSKNGEPIDAEGLLGPISNFTGAFTGLGIFEMGDNGTCIRLVDQYDFSGKDW